MMQYTTINILLRVGLVAAFVMLLIPIHCVADGNVTILQARPDRVSIGRGVLIKIRRDDQSQNNLVIKDDSDESECVINYPERACIYYPLKIGVKNVAAYNATSNGIVQVSASKRISVINNIYPKRISIIGIQNQPDAMERQFNQNCLNPSISSNSEFVIFETIATNVPIEEGFDTNNLSDIYKYDMITEKYSIISSTNSDRLQASNGTSRNAKISDNDRYVVFESNSTDIASIGNSSFSIFRKDLSKNITDVVSLTNNGSIPGSSRALKPSISSDGRFVLFESLSGFTEDDPALYRRNDLFLRDILNSTTTLLTGSRNGVEDFFDAGDSAMSVDGRYVAFSSPSSRFIGDVDVNLIYLLDTKTNELITVTFNANGQTPNSNSFKPKIIRGKKDIIFTSHATDLINPKISLSGPFYFKYDATTKTIDYFPSMPLSGRGLNPSYTDGTFYDMSMPAGKGVFINAFTYNKDDPFLATKNNIYTYNQSTQSVLFKTHVKTTQSGSYHVSIASDGDYLTYHDSIDNVYKYGLPRMSCIVAAFSSSDDVDISRFYAPPEPDNNSGRVPFNGYFDPFLGSIYSSSVANNGNSASFVSESDNLIDNVFDEDGVEQLYYHNKGNIRHVAKSINGGYINSFIQSMIISGNGEKIFFLTSADNVNVTQDNDRSQLYIYDTINDNIVKVPIAKSIGQNLQCVLSENCIDRISISNDSSVVAYTSNYRNLDDPTSNRLTDIIRHNLIDQSSVRITRSFTNGSEPTSRSDDPDCSSDCNFIVYTASGNNVIPNESLSNAVLIYDYNTDSTSVVSYNLDNVTIASSTVTPSISGDGRYVAYVIGTSYQVVEQDLLGPAHIILRDRLAETNTLVSISLDGNASDGFSYSPQVTDDGNYIIYSSNSKNIVADDNNNSSDIFIYDIHKKKNYLLSKNNVGDQLNGNSDSPSLSANGKFVIFSTTASNANPDDTNGQDDVYILPISHHQIQFKDDFD